MTKTIIADSSPLIVLLKSDLENILPALFKEIFIPEAVWQEILAGGETDVAQQKLPFLFWARKVSKITLKPAVVNYNLGKGETEALSLASETSESVIIIDDFAARKCAGDLKIAYIGTGGLLIAAKQKNLIPSVSEALETVQNNGLWISGSIIQMLREKAGE